MTLDTAPAVLNRSAWEDVFKGYEIVGVAIRDRTTLQTVARQSMPPDAASHLLDGQIATRVATIFLDGPSEDNVGFRELKGMTHPRIGVSRAPFHEGVLVASMDRDGDTYPAGGGLDGPWEKVDAGHWPGIQRLRSLGNQTYAVALARRLYKRTGVGRWDLVEGIPMSSDEGELRSAGFRDLDGFSETDLYAVGGHGDVWHFDGREWRQMGFPTNEQLATVTCAGDGNVYITSEGGTLWVGPQSTWRELEKGGSSVLWNDTRWFDGKLWLASDYQLRVWNGREIAVPEHEGKPVLASGHMDAHDGLLVVADLWSVSTFDGREWRKVVVPYAD
ncbi:hypothetical protein [Roseateles chitosanitabidus]|uniref:hypothetical protein n=1 Tax=Roseateles chitosanitabidus TaxID=65048 RepID=UPI00082A78D1|nr:hypothetical protein [Roseateles chitosanitabidus]